MPADDKPLPPADQRKPLPPPGGGSPAEESSGARPEAHGWAAPAAATPRLPGVAAGLPGSADSWDDAAMGGPGAGRPGTPPPGEWDPELGMERAPTVRRPLLPSVLATLVSPLRLRGISLTHLSV